jgi:Mn-dependent DtxR family transcriptional regulator
MTIAELCRGAYIAPLINAGLAPMWLRTALKAYDTHAEMVAQGSVAPVKQTAERLGIKYSTAKWYINKMKKQCLL